MGVINRMTLYRRFVRAKKGMSTIFGALFFIILVLMGFNLMLWNFVQFDAYNHVVTTMSQRDQQASSENLVVVQPGACDPGNLTACVNPKSNNFNIMVTNLGGNSIIITEIYINNITGSCISGLACYFTNGNIQIGELNHLISVHGIGVGDGSGYRIVLATSRGRQFSFYYPWPTTVSNGGGGGGGSTGGQFQSNVGPLVIYFDYSSFNFTIGSQTLSQSRSAFCVPSSTNMVIILKLANTAYDSKVTLLPSTVIQLQGYGVNGFGQFITTWIVDPGTVNPSNIQPYAMNNNYTLPAATVNGPSAFVRVMFGGTSQGGTGGLSFSRDNNWIMFIGFYYLYRGLPQGETVPFMVMKSTGGYPGTCTQ
jgi:hypothetical protein